MHEMQGNLFSLWFLTLQDNYEKSWLNNNDLTDVDRYEPRIEGDQEPANND